MGIKYLWDTNTAIYYLQQQFPTSSELFIDSTFSDSNPAISVITEIELLCWKTAMDKDLEILHDFINDALVFELEKDIKLKTAAIHKSHKVKLPDAIIAATALVHDLTLLIRNVSDFKNIDGINLINQLEK